MGLFSKIFREAVRPFRPATNMIVPVDDISRSLGGSTQAVHHTAAEASRLLQRATPAIDRVNTLLAAIDPNQISSIQTNTAAFAESFVRCGDFLDAYLERNQVAINRAPDEIVDLLSALNELARQLRLQELQAELTSTMNSVKRAAISVESATGIARGILQIVSYGFAALCFYRYMNEDSQFKTMSENQEIGATALIFAVVAIYTSQNTWVAESAANFCISLFSQAIQLLKWRPNWNGAEPASRALIEHLETDYSNESEIIHWLFRDNPVPAEAPSTKVVTQWRAAIEASELEKIEALLREYSVLLALKFSDGRTGFHLAFEKSSSEVISFFIGELEKLNSTLASSQIHNAPEDWKAIEHVAEIRDIGKAVFLDENGLNIAKASDQQLRSFTPFVLSQAVRMYQEHRDELQPRKDEAEVRLANSKLFEHIGRANDDDLKAIEKILVDDPDLIFAQGKLVEPNGREFRHISAWQHVLWSGDPDLLNMLLAHVGGDADRLALAREQYDQLVERPWEVSNHGSNYDLQPLIDADQKYLDKYSGWDDEQRCHQWCRVIGGLQRQLPAWIMYAWYEKGDDVAWVTKSLSGYTPEQELTITRDTEAMNRFLKSEIHGVPSGDVGVVVRGSLLMDVRILYAGSTIVYETADKNLVLHDTDVLKKCRQTPESKDYLKSRLHAEESNMRAGLRQ